MYGRPYRSADEELEETLRRGESRFHPQPPPGQGLRSFVATVLWIAAILVIGFFLISIGVIDPTTLGD